MHWPVRVAAHFLYKGTGPIEDWGGEGIIPDVQKNAHIEYGTAACPHPAQATICDKRLRTLNTNAECGAADDYFYYVSWQPCVAPTMVYSVYCRTRGGIRAVHQ